MVNRYIEHELGEFAVDLFPYKIKNVKKFLFRNHPTNINPNSIQYQRYWEGELRKYIEGAWIDDDGTWVYMFPKLYFFINYTTIVDEERNIINPDLTDIEWIISTYLYCCLGFSGFDGDEEYTCNELVGKLENGEKLLSYEKQWLDDSEYVKKKDGKYKKYVNAWTYLTEHYLITHNQGKPLGLPLYENQLYNLVILGARGVRKSFSLFMMDLLHEWLTGGAQRYGEDVNKPLLFAITSWNADPINKSLSLLQRFYNNMPGSFTFDDESGLKVYGAMYKNIKGEFKSGSSVEHIVKTTTNITDIVGSVLHTKVIQKEPKVLAGDRYRRLYVEEFGFVKNIKNVYASAKDNLKVGKKRVGMMVAIGTSGEGDAIKGPKEMFESPRVYDIYPIPNYWERGKKVECGLFLPATYKSKEFKNKNGNTNLEEALYDIVDFRVKLKEEADNQTFNSELLSNPIYPKEMMKPEYKNLFPITELSDKYSELMNEGLFEKTCKVGELFFDPSADRGVKFQQDLKKRLKPITAFGTNEETVGDKRGAIVIIEDVIKNPPKGLYHVVLDPVQISGEGTSLMSAIVYKGYYMGYEDSGEMYDAIVCEWKGRRENVTDGFWEVIKMARYYNAQIFTEINSPYFLEWCRDNNLLDMLFGQPIETLRDLAGGQNIKINYFKKGVYMNERLNNASLLKLSAWVNGIKERNEKGLPTKYNFEDIKSPGILSELILFQPEEKQYFDHISALYLLMILKTEIEKDPSKIKLEEDEDPYDKYNYYNLKTSNVRRRSSILNY